MKNPPSISIDIYDRNMEMRVELSNEKQPPEFNFFAPEKMEFYISNLTVFLTDLIILGPIIFGIYRQSPIFSLVAKKIL